MNEKKPVKEKAKDKAPAPVVEKPQAPAPVADVAPVVKPATPAPVAPKAKAPRMFFDPLCPNGPIPKQTPGPSPEFIKAVEDEIKRTGRVSTVETKRMGRK